MSKPQVFLGHMAQVMCDAAQAIQHALDAAGLRAKVHVGDIPPDVDLPPLEDGMELLTALAIKVDIDPEMSNNDRERTMRLVNEIMREQMQRVPRPTVH